MDKKRLESRSTQSSAGNPVSPRKGHPFIAPRPRSRKSEENRTAPVRFPNGSLSLETSSINKRAASEALQKEYASFFIELAWFPSSSELEKGGRGEGEGGIAGGGGSRTVFVVQE